MKKFHIPISLPQKFNEVMPLIPSNSLFFKNITNIGATFCEIENQTRPSLIIEPNTPVIIGKARQHDNVIAVYAKITLEDITRQINRIRSSGKMVKIMCTPESYTKAVRALKFAGFDAYNDVFCLFDECEKLAKDVHYREDIIMPLDYFFKFKNKAFISATAMEPSDPRFNSFDRYYLVPTESIAVPIQLYPTNNTLFTLGDLLKARGERHFIFLNSIYSIVGFINILKLPEEEVSIFASSKASQRLKLQGFKNVHDKIDENRFTKYNFFTSRYFSAVDIYVNYDVNIYIITDVLLASFTAIDPKTDAVQIHGRFRNKQYKRNLYSIFSVSQNFDVLSENELEFQEFLIVELHKIIQTYMLTLNNEGSKIQLINIFKAFPFGKFIDTKGNINYYMKDNIYYLNKVKRLYTDYDLVINSYRDAKAEETDLPYFSIEFMRLHEHSLSMAEMSIVNSKYSFNSFVTSFMEAMDNINGRLINEPKNESLLGQLDNLKQNFPELFKVYDFERKAGLDVLQYCKSKKELTFLSIEYGIRLLSSNNPLIEEIKLEFPKGDFIPERDLVDRFSSILNSHDTTLIASKANLERFLKLSKRTTRNKKKGYIIQDYLL
ncbi:hypothetical protein [Sphingobacterium mizutaii]|uniref:hypothetical protein n=1 Tax=Sphingobacterium mizutaii TaxID=1010 RepID=UPI0016282BAD|nr:hypothetical protein [Sphingobacterium mizutaii]